ncbi:hypothetical protein M3J09_013488 [Ascochyta lentis]
MTCTCTSDPPLFLSFPAGLTLKILISVSTKHHTSTVSPPPSLVLLYLSQPSTSNTLPLAAIPPITIMTTPRPLTGNPNAHDPSKFSTSLSSTCLCKAIT